MAITSKSINSSSDWLTNEEKDWIFSLFDYYWINRQDFVRKVQSFRIVITKHQVYGVIKRELKIGRITEKKDLVDGRLKYYKLREDFK